MNIESGNNQLMSSLTYAPPKVALNPITYPVDAIVQGQLMLLAVS